MNPILLALLLTGPFRPLASLDGGDNRPVIDSLNDILGDHWLELPASRPLSCDGPCTEAAAAVPMIDCGDLKERVTKAQRGWLDVRQAAFVLGEALEQSFDASQAAHARLAAAMASTRAILSESELSPSLFVQREWRLAPDQVLPGMPGAWPKHGAGFRIERKTGRILDGRILDVQSVTKGAVVVVRAKMAVAPVEYCAGDISYRIEGAVTFLRETTSGSLTVPLPLSTNLALTTSAASVAQQILTFPGDL